MASKRDRCESLVLVRTASPISDTWRGELFSMRNIIEEDASTSGAYTAKDELMVRQLQCTSLILSHSPSLYIFLRLAVHAVTFTRKREGITDRRWAIAHGRCIPRRPEATAGAGLRGPPHHLCSLREPDDVSRVSCTWTPFYPGARSFNASFLLALSYWHSPSFHPL